MSPLLVGFLVLCLGLPPQSAYALRTESTKQSAGLEDLEETVRAAGLEEEFVRGKRVASFDPLRGEKRSVLARDIPVGSVLLIALAEADKKSGENYAVIHVESGGLAVLRPAAFEPPETGRTRAVTLLEADPQGIPIRVRIEQRGWQLHAGRGKESIELDSLHLVLRREVSGLSLSWLPAWIQSFQVFLLSPVEAVVVADSVGPAEDKVDKGPPAPPRASKEKAPETEADRERKSAQDFSGPYAGPEVDAKSAVFSKEPDEDTLIDQISQEIRSGEIFYDRGLGVAMTDSQNPTEWQSKIPLVMLAAAAPREGDIVIVQEGALQGRGAWFGQGTGTLYLEPRALREADPEMIRVAMARGELDYLNAWWAAKHRPELAGAQASVSSPKLVSLPPALAGKGEQPKPAARPVAVAPTKSPPPTPSRTLKDEMIPLARKAAAGEMLANSAQVEHRPAQAKTVIRINGRDSKTPSWESFVVPVEFGPEPILPDVRGMQGQQLEAEFEWGEIAVRMRARNAAAHRIFVSLQRADANLSELLHGTPDAAQNWVKRISGDISEALEAALADREPTAGNLQTAAQQVSAAIRREASAVGELLRLQDRLRKPAVDGQVSASEISSAFDSLPPEVLALPENAARIRFHRQRLSSQRARVSLWEELDVLTDLVDVWRFQNRENLSASTEPADLHAVYYRSALEGLRESLRALDPSGDPAQTGWDAVALGRLVVRLELERCCLELIRERAKGRPSGMLLNYPNSAVGVLFLDSKGRPRRFVEGGGSTWSVSSVHAFFSPDQIAEWFEPGDSAVIPVYYSLTGAPASYYLATFLARQTPAIQDRIRTRRGAAAPEVWLGTLDGKGALRLFRPALPPMGSPEWQDRFLPVAEQDERFLGVRLHVQGNVLKAPDRFRPAAARGGTPSTSKLTAQFGQKTQLKTIGEAAIEWVRAKLRSVMAELETALKPFGPRAARLFVQEGTRRFAEDWGEITAKVDRPTQEQVYRLERWALMTLLLADEHFAGRLLPQLFSQQQIEGVTEPTPPELLDLDRPPGEILHPDQLGDQLGKRVAQLFEKGVLHLPNLIVFDRVNGKVAVDLTDLPDPGFIMTLIDDQLTYFQAFPFIPTAGLPGEPIHFSGERGSDSAKAVLRESSPLSAELWDDTLPTLTELSRQAPGEPGRKLFSQVADRTRAALGQGNPSEQIVALKRERPSDAGQIDAALADIAQAARRELDLFDAIHQASTLVKTAGRKEESGLEETKTVPVSLMRQILSDLQAKSAGHPQVEAAVGGYLGLLPAEGEVSASDWQDRIENLRAVGRRELELGLAAHPSELLQAVYYDAVRLAFLTEVDRLLQGADQASDQAVWKRLIERWIILILRVVGNELEAGVTNRLRRTAKDLPAAAKFGEFHFSGIGVGFLNGHGKIRFIPSGGVPSMSIGPHAGTQFDPRWIKAWFLPGERVILFYSSRTGGLHAEQFIATVDDLFYLRTFLPDVPVLVCCVTPEEKTAFYEITTPPIEDRAGWGRLFTEAIRLSEASISFENKVRSRSDTSQGTLSGEKWRQHVVRILSHFQQILEEEITRAAPEQAETIVAAIRRQFRSDLELFRDMKFLQDEKLSMIGAKTDAQKRVLIRRNKDLNRKFKPAQERLWEMRSIAITMVQEALTASVTGSEGLIRPVNPFVPSGGAAAVGTRRADEEDIRGAIAGLVGRAAQAHSEWAREELEAFAAEWLEQGELDGRKVRAVLEAGEPIRQVDFNNMFKSWKAIKGQEAEEGRQAAALARQEQRREQAAVVERAVQIAQGLRHQVDHRDLAAVERALAETAADLAQLDEKSAPLLRISREQLVERFAEYVLSEADALVAPQAGLESEEEKLRQVDSRIDAAIRLLGDPPSQPGFVSALQAAKARLQLALQVFQKLREMNELTQLAEAKDVEQVSQILAETATLVPGQFDPRWKERLQTARSELAQGFFQKVIAQAGATPPGQEAESFQLLEKAIQALAGFDSLQQQIRGKQTPLQAAAQKEKEHQAQARNNQLLAGSQNPQEVATILLSDGRFQDFLKKEPVIETFLHSVVSGKPKKAGAARTHAQPKLHNTQGDTRLFYRSVYRLTNLVEQAGLENKSSKEIVQFSIAGDLKATADPELWIQPLRWKTSTEQVVRRILRRHFPSEGHLKAWAVLGGPGRGEATEFMGLLVNSTLIPSPQATYFEVVGSIREALQIFDLRVLDLSAVKEFETSGQVGIRLSTAGLEGGRVLGYLRQLADQINGDQNPLFHVELDDRGVVRRLEARANPQFLFPEFRQDVRLLAYGREFGLILLSSANGRIERLSPEGFVKQVLHPGPGFSLPAQEQDRLFTALIDGEGVADVLFGPSIMRSELMSLSSDAKRESQLGRVTFKLLDGNEVEVLVRPREWSLLTDSGIKPGQNERVQASHLLEEQLRQVIKDSFLARHLDKLEKQAPLSFQWRAPLKKPRKATWAELVLKIQPVSHTPGDTPQLFDVDLSLTIRTLAGELSKDYPNSLLKGNFTPPELISELKKKIDQLEGTQFLVAPWKKLEGIHLIVLPDAAGIVSVLSRVAPFLGPQESEAQKSQVVVITRDHSQKDAISAAMNDFPVHYPNLQENDLVSMGEYPGNVDQQLRAALLQAWQRISPSAWADVHSLVILAGKRWTKKSLLARLPLKVDPDNVTLITVPEPQQPPKEAVKELLRQLGIRVVRGGGPAVHDLINLAWRQQMGLAVVTAGLEEGFVAEAMEVAKESQQGKHAVVIDASLFAQHAGLEAFLKRLPVNENHLFVIVGAGSASAQEIQAWNPQVKVADTVEDAVVRHLLSFDGHVVSALGNEAFLAALENYLRAFAIEVAKLDLRLGLWVVLEAAGVPREVLQQLNWDSLQSALASLEAA